MRSVGLQVCIDNNYIVFVVKFIYKKKLSRYVPDEKMRNTCPMGVTNIFNFWTMTDALAFLPPLNLVVIGFYRVQNNNLRNNEEIIELEFDGSRVFFLIFR